MAIKNWKKQDVILTLQMKIGHREMVITREHHFHQVSFLNVTGRFNQLQDVVGACVMFEQQNLVINPVEATLWELQQTEKP